MPLSFLINTPENPLRLFFASDIQPLILELNKSISEELDLSFAADIAVISLLLAKEMETLAKLLSKGK